MMFSPFGMPFGMRAAQSREPVKNYTLEEQRALASKTVRKVRAFLHGGHRWEARYADYPNDRVTIKSGGVVLSAAQLEVGVRYNVFWDYEGETGEDLGWKSRGDGGFAGTVCDMEESMADDPNIGMPGNLLQMASTSWAQSFYDMVVNWEVHRSVVRPEAPRPEHDSDDEDEEYQPNYAAMVAEKWNPIFERVKADEHDVECMFFHTTQGCLAAAGTCPFKHTPLRDIHSSDSGMYATQSEPVKNYTLGEQRELADKAIRKVCAFLHGAHRWEARYADYPNDSVTIDSSGVVLSAAQLEVGVRYNVFWDYEGKKGEDLGWKFRGDGGLAGTICGMEESMAVDPNIGMPGNLLQMASTSWARSFYDMVVNLEVHGSIVPPEAPRAEHDPDHQEHQPKLSNCAALVAEKWNPIFERVKADEHDVECMFFHTRQGCLVAAGTCPFKHTPLKDIPFSDDASHQASEISALLMSVDPHGYYMGDWD